MSSDSEVARLRKAIQGLQAKIASAARRRKALDEMTREAEDLGLYD